MFFRYPIEGGEAPPVKWLTRRDNLIHWRAGGKSMLRNQGSEIPCRIESVDLDTGQRELFKEIAPDNLVGLTQLRPLFFTDDERSSVYGVLRQTSGLFVSARSE